MTQRGCCALLHLHEDNARFILLFIVMILYMLAGATVFMILERDQELEDRNTYHHEVGLFLKTNPCVNQVDLKRILSIHHEAASSGILPQTRERWDFSGSFYFVGTVVSTIGKINFLIK